MTTHAVGSPTSAPGPRVRPLQLRLAVLVPLLAAVLAVTRAVNVAVGTGPFVDLVVGSATAAGALLLYAWVVRRLEHRRVDELALSAACGGLGRGLVIGLLTFSATIAAIAVLGGYRVTGWGSVSALVAGAGAMASVAANEELLFRGVIFRLAEDRLGTRAALVLSAALFAALHLVNPHATVWGATALAIEAGGMLAAAYAATRTLWLPIGLHLAWNLAEGSIYGTTVSGSSDSTSASLLTAALHGPTALTGGSFGPEASVPALLACLVPTVLFLRLAQRRGNLRPRTTGASRRAQQTRLPGASVTDPND